MRPRTAITATLASLGVLGLSFGIGVEGQALLHPTATTDTAAGNSSSASAGSGGQAAANGQESASASPSASSSASTDSSKYKDGTYTGTAVSTRYGDVQVKVTVASGKVTASDAVEYPTNDPRDQQINEAAVPILNSEVTQAQSASISQVSGATFTSDGYIQSLQSALDQAT